MSTLALPNLSDLVTDEMFEAIVDPAFASPVGNTVQLRVGEPTIFSNVEVLGNTANVLVTLRGTPRLSQIMLREQGRAVNGVADMSAGTYNVVAGTVRGIAADISVNWGDGEVDLYDVLYQIATMPYAAKNEKAPFSREAFVAGLASRGFSLTRGTMAATFQHLGADVDGYNAAREALLAAGAVPQANLSVSERSRTVSGAQFPSGTTDRNRGVALEGFEFTADLSDLRPDGIDNPASAIIDNYLDMVRLDVVTRARYDVGTDEFDAGRRAASQWMNSIGGTIRRSVAGAGGGRVEVDPVIRDPRRISCGRLFLPGGESFDFWTNNTATSDAAVAAISAASKAEAAEAALSQVSANDVDF